MSWIEVGCFGILRQMPRREIGILLDRSSLSQAAIQSFSETRCPPLWAPRHSEGATVLEWSLATWLQRFSDLSSLFVQGAGSRV